MNGCFRATPRIENIGALDSNHISPPERGGMVRREHSGEETPDVGKRMEELAQIQGQNRSNMLVA